MALEEVRMEAAWNGLKGELERELHSSPWGFCCQFKSWKVKRQNFIICNHETVYITVVLSFYIAAFFTFIFLKKKKNNRSKTMKEQS